MNNSTVRIRLDLAYDGTDFHGWAKQGTSDLRTVQKVLEDNLSMVLRETVELTVAGRTDAGVHAAGQVAHFDIPAHALEQRSIDGDPSKLVRRLGRLLPDDIRVHGVRFAEPGFDARFSAMRRHYVYRITTHPAGALPTRRHDTAQWPKPVELAPMHCWGCMISWRFAKLSHMRRRCVNYKNLRGKTSPPTSNRRCMKHTWWPMLFVGRWCARWSAPAWPWAKDAADQGLLQNCLMQANVAPWFQ